MLWFVPFHLLKLYFLNYSAHFIESKYEMCLTFIKRARTLVLYIRKELSALLFGDRAAGLLVLCLFSLALIFLRWFFGDGADV
jgi:hypothetical protein